MSGQNRFPVVPTVTVLGQMKARLAGATKGHALLKKKADALTMRFRQVLTTVLRRAGGEMRPGGGAVAPRARDALVRTVPTILPPRVSHRSSRKLWRRKRPWARRCGRPRSRSRRRGESFAAQSCSQLRLQALRC